MNNVACTYLHDKIDQCLNCAEKRVSSASAGSHGACTVGQNTGLSSGNLFCPLTSKLTLDVGLCFVGRALVSEETPGKCGTACEQLMRERAGRSL